MTTPVLEAHGLSIIAPITPEYETILTTKALEFVAKLVEQHGPQLESLLADREIFQKQIDEGSLPDFLTETAHIRDGDWKVAPIPNDLLNRCVEITGPVDRKMIINALNSPVNVFMADFEDAQSPTWNGLIQGQVNMRDANLGTIEHTNPDGKHYQLNDNPALLIARVRGLHLPEKHVTYNGKAIPGCLLDFGLYFYHNAKLRIKNGSGPYFYIPKLESHHEARWWNDVFTTAQNTLGIPVGSIKATILIETLPAVFEMDEILFELKDHIVGLNCGRWDYIFSFIKTFRNHANKILPDRNSVTMDKHFLDSYSKLLIQTCHKRGAFAMGGMAAFIPIKNDEAANQAAFEKVRADKVREVTNGHDGTWVAHPGLAPLARESFKAHMSGDNQLDKQLSVHITAADLLEVPTGEITEAGLRNNIKVAVQYIEAWISGNGCVPLYNLMEDAATAEISRTQIWQWIHHDAGKLNDGRDINTDLFRAMLDQEMEVIRQELGDVRFNSGKFSQAKDIMDQITTSDTCVDFLTLPAYDHLD